MNIQNGIIQAVNAVRAVRQKDQEFSKGLMDGISNTLLYDKESKRPFPSSPVHNLMDISKAPLGSPESIQASMDLGGKVMMAGTTAVNRSLLDKTGQKVVQNSGFIDEMANRFDQGVTDVKLNQQVDLGLDNQARSMFKEVFNKDPKNEPLSNIMGKLKEAADGYRTEQTMRAGGQIVPKRANPVTVNPQPNPNPLAAEARKYKSADEFVKGQGESVYHETQPQIWKKINLEGFKQNKDNKVFFSASPKYGKGGGLFNAGKDASVQEVKLPRSTNVLNITARNIDELGSEFEAIKKINNLKSDNQTVKWLGDNGWYDMSRKQKSDFVSKTLEDSGYSGISFVDGLNPTGKTIVFYDKNIISQIKTKSQLTDIYNQAQKSQQVQNVVKAVESYRKK